MTKAKGLLRLFFCLFFVLAEFNFQSLPARAETMQWSAINLPASGPGNHWVLAEAPNKRCLTTAPDGSLYCYADPSGTPFRLFKSTDHGYSWSYTGLVQDNIVDIAVLPDNSNDIFYATSSAIYRSADAGNNFSPQAAAPGGAGTGSRTITSLDVVSVNGSCLVAVSVIDSAASAFGGVYIWDESQPAVWQDAGLHLDVYAVAFSPDYTTDRQIVAVASDEHNTRITTMLAGAGWGTKIGDASVAGLPLSSAAIAFPADYQSDITSGKYLQFIALNTGAGAGDVYKLNGLAAPGASQLQSCRLHKDITGLSVSGNATTANILAGAASSAQTFFSGDEGRTWKTMLKPPTGGSSTSVSIAPDFNSSGLLYALTSGPESAFSLSRDQGFTWDQTGLINTRITAMKDLAISPDYGHDQTLFLLSTDGQQSLWFSSSGGSHWERRFSSTLTQDGIIDKVLISPHYSQDREVYLADQDNPYIWKSTDSGRSFTCVDSLDPDTGAPVNIDAWTITPTDALLVGSFDGHQSTIYQTGPNTLTYVGKASTGNYKLNALALSPDFSRDGTILAGDISGSIFLSQDNGRVFEALPWGCLQPPLSGHISVAFDPDYSLNHTVYAGGDDANEGIFRFAVGSSTSWKSINSSLSVQAKIVQVVTSPNGLLYAINTRAVDQTRAAGGIARILDPRSESLPACEIVNTGLENGTFLRQIWVQGNNNIWGIGDINASGKLLTYTDTLASSPALVSPPDKAANLVSQNVTLSWTPLTGATGYHWQIDTDSQFGHIPAGLEGDVDVTSIKPAKLDANTTYYWRLRAIQPETSPWSAIWSFNTDFLPSPPSLAVPKLSEPKFNSLCSRQPTFKWSTSAGADRYELQVATDNNFAAPVIDKSGDQAFSTDAWICDITLDYNTGYYWRVRAVAGNLKSNWSDVSVFKTVSEPTPISHSIVSSSGGNSAAAAPQPTDSPQPAASATPSAKATPKVTPSVIPSVAHSSTSPVSTSPASISENSSINAFNPLDASTSGMSTRGVSPTASAIISPSAAISSAPSTEPSGPASFLSYLIAGLVVLTLALVIVMIFMLKKFKKN